MIALDPLSSAVVKPLDEALLSRWQEQLAPRLAQIKSQLPPQVTLVGVSKNAPAEAIYAAHQLGLGCVGENRIVDALGKQGQLKALCPELNWHLIGHLQGNKALKALGAFQLIQSVDTVALAQRLNRLAAQANQQQAILLQINISNEPQKSGFDPSQPQLFLDAVLPLFALPHLQIKGIMGLAAHGISQKQAQTQFGQAQKTLVLLNQHLPTPLTTLSIGMSEDWQAAVNQGSTMVRIGRALFADASL